MGYFVRRQKAGIGGGSHLEAHRGQRAAFPLHPAESAPLPRSGVTLTPCRHHRLRLEHVLGPVLKGLRRDFPRRHITDAGLHDSHPHGRNIVGERLRHIGTEAIEHHLRVALRVHAYALAILEVDHVHHPIGDNDRVSRAERAGGVIAELHTPLHQKAGIRADPLSLGQLRQHDRHILIGVFVHLAGAEARPQSGDLLVLAPVVFTEPLLQLAGRHRVGQRPLKGEIGLRVRLARLKHSRGSAAQPPVGGRRA